jgi:hypothetical protein
MINEKKLIANVVVELKNLDKAVIKILFVKCPIN